MTPALSVPLGRITMARDGHTLSILVVEDDHAVAELLRALLNQVSGWGATVVHDAAAARDVFRHVNVEALVLDVNLPGISGIELLDLLEQDETWRDPPVILTSADGDLDAILRLIEQRPKVRFIAKPFDVDEILATLVEVTDVETQQTALQEKLGTSQPPRTSRIATA